MNSPKLALCVNTSCIIHHRTDASHQCTTRPTCTDLHSSESKHCTVYTDSWEVMLTLLTSWLHSGRSRQGHAVSCQFSQATASYLYYILYTHTHTYNTYSWGVHCDDHRWFQPANCSIERSARGKPRPSSANTKRSSKLVTERGWLLIGSRILACWFLIITGNVRFYSAVFSLKRKDMYLFFNKWTINYLYSAQSTPAIFEFSIPL